MPTARLDPTPIFEFYRGSYGTEVLAAALFHFDLFPRLSQRPMTVAELGCALGLADRPTTVMVIVLRAMGLLVADSAGRLNLTDLAREALLSTSPFDVSGYVGFAASSPGVLEMVERLRTNRPGGTKPDEQGAIHIYREGLKSAMELEATARRLTLALAGRARAAAPVLAQRVNLQHARLVVDVAGGSGIYSFALLQANPRLRAIIMDRPQVLKVTQELASDYGVADRVQCLPGDMFSTDLPPADVVLFSNVLHDWDVPEGQWLIGRAAAALPSGGRLLIHDVFLNDALDGPLPLALYAAQLFCMTEGRVYSAAEYRDWLTQGGFTAAEEVLPTMVHNMGVLTGTKK
jgi:hypothetical protein